MGVADVPQYVGSRVAASHGHIFNFSHEISPSPSPSHSHSHSHSHAQSQGHGHGLSLSHLPHSEQQQQQPDHPNDLQQEVMSQKPHFIQSHQQSQHGFAMSMNTPKAPPLPQQQSEALQSSQIKQVQVDNNHHQKKQQQQQQDDHVQQSHQGHQQQATILQQQQQETTLEAHDSSPPRALNLSLNEGLITGEGSLDGEEEGEREGAGSRWPKQEAIALLKIRSDMATAFRESSLKGPLWEEISRKLADMGYHRSAKKCKEKFENVYKYYKRTKDGKIGRQDGKNYRFFSQLEALYGKAAADINNSTNLSNKNLNISTPPGLLTAGNINVDNGVPGLGLSDAARNINRPSLPSTGNTTPAAARTAHITQILETVESFKHDSDNSSRLNFSHESSEEDELDGPVEGGAENTSSRKRKRKSVKKYLVFFENVMKKVLDKQEQMQQKFLEALERRDQDRMIREEAWKMQEISMLNREHDLRAQERALSASHDVSLVAFLQKMTGQTLALPHIALNSNSAAIIPADDIQDDYQHDKHDPTSKRWPKPEVLALIKLRTTLDKKFHEPGSKAVLWEEISADMSSQGYSRTAKRCKEKWENINKYFKKAKDSNKKRPENAKTCPYFHHLNALYKEGLLSGGGSNISSKQLMVIGKGEEHPEDVLEQGNTSNTREDSGQALQEGDPEILATEEIEGPGLNPTPIAATTSATTTATATTSKAPSTTTASNDATMQLFMSSDSQPIIDSAIGNHPATTNSSPLILERMDSSIILSAGPAKQPSG